MQNRISVSNSAPPPQVLHITSIINEIGADHIASCKDGRERERGLDLVSVHVQPSHNLTNPISNISRNETTPICDKQHKATELFPGRQRKSVKN